jgi:hypothetical protein
LVLIGAIPYKQLSITRLQLNYSLLLVSRDVKTICPLWMIGVQGNLYRLKQMQKI